MSEPLQMLLISMDQPSPSHVAGSFKFSMNVTCLETFFHVLTIHSKYLPRHQFSLLVYYVVSTTA